MSFVRFLTLLTALFVLGNFAGAQAPPPAKKAPSVAATSAPAGELVDINHATAPELKALPGIGDAYSGAIIRNRPYKNKTQLRSKNVIPPATYEKIRDKIIAKQ